MVPVTHPGRDGEQLGPAHAVAFEQPSRGSDGGGALAGLVAIEQRQQLSQPLVGAARSCVAWGARRTAGTEQGRYP